MKVATHIVFAECCFFAVSAVGDVHYGTTAVLATAAASILLDADYPRSWIGHQLGSVSRDLNRIFGHRSFLHSLLALALFGVLLYPALWLWIGMPDAWLAALVGYGSHLFADMMTLGGVQLLYPSRLICVFPGRDEYRVVSGRGSERVFVAFALVLALLFYPISRVGFDGLLYRLGGEDEVYGEVARVIDGDIVEVEVQGRTQPVRLIGVDAPETVAPDEPIGCYGRVASDYTKEILYEPRTDDEGEVAREGRLVRLEVPRIGNSEDAYGRTLTYIYLDTSGDGNYGYLYNERLLELGHARTTTFSHTYSREFERIEEEAELRGVGLWDACPGVEQ